MANKINSNCKEDYATDAERRSAMDGVMDKVYRSSIIHDMLKEMGYTPSVRSIEASKKSETRHEE